MTVKRYFINLYEYEFWANNKILTYMESDTPSKNVIDIFSHMVADMKPWVMLLNKESVSDNIECLPSWNIQQCREALEDVSARINGLIYSFESTDFENKLSSAGRNGQEFVNTVIEVLTQIVTHSQHHRGQIEMLIKDESDLNLPTTYMSYLRNKNRSHNKKIEPTLKNARPI